MKFKNALSLIFLGQIEYVSVFWLAYLTAKLSQSSTRALCQTSLSFAMHFSISLKRIYPPKYHSVENVMSKVEKRISRKN